MSTTSSLPDVPTVAEQGFPGFEMTQWYGLLAPSTMAKANVDKLAAASVLAIKEPAALKLLESEAAVAVGSAGRVRQVHRGRAAALAAGDRAGEDQAGLTVPPPGIAPPVIPPPVASVGKGSNSRVGERLLRRAAMDRFGSRVPVRRFRYRSLGSPCRFLPQMSATRWR